MSGAGQGGPEPAVQLARGGSFADRRDWTARMARISCPQDTLVVCASPTAAQALRALLPGFDVATALDLAARVLDIPGMAERLGRPHARILDSLDRRLLDEDLMGCGLKPGQLRMLTSFLDRSWASLASEDASWIVTAEEQRFIDRLHDRLAFTGGVLPSEAPVFALRLLRKDADARARFERKRVVVCDFGLLSRASQHLVRLMATDLLVAVTPDADLPAAEEAYPCPEGFGELASSAASDAQVLVKPRPRDDAAGPAPLATFETIEGELRGIARMAAGARAQGAHSVLVVGADKTWRANALRALRAAGMPARAVRAKRGGAFKGDLRDGQRCRAFHNQTLERLSVDDSDGLAWRALVGLGDYTGASGEAELLRTLAQPQGLDIAAALAALADGSLALRAEDARALAPIAERYEAACRALTQAGEAADETPSPHAGMGTDASGAPEPASVGTPAPEPVSAPGGDDFSVLVGPPESAYGHAADVVVFGGFVNGIIPARGYFDSTALVGAKRERELERSLRAIAAAQDAGRNCAFTAFTTCDLETAERLQVHIERIALKGGLRRATTSPSCLLPARR